VSDTIHRYILAYDVSSDTTRARVATTLESYGDRLQYSVFLIDTKPARMVRLTTAVAGLIETATDSLLVCDLGPLDGEGGRRIEFVGSRRPITEHGPLIL
jgi:CRISPR-associated protein Cas2